MNQIELLERRARLWHIEQAAAEILEFISSKTISDFDSDRMLKAAVERDLIIIGEALSRAMAVDPTLIEQISDVRGIIGLRNQLIHNYPQIEAEQVWQILQTDLPKLLSEVRALLSSSPSPGANPA